MFCFFKQLAKRVGQKGSTSTSRMSQIKHLSGVEKLCNLLAINGDTFVVKDQGSIRTSNFGHFQK